MLLIQQGEVMGCDGGKRDMREMRENGSGMEGEDAEQAMAELESLLLSDIEDIIK